jgi:hypothetical protein
VEWAGSETRVPALLEAAPGLPSLGGAHLPHIHQVPSVIARQECINLIESARATHVQALSAEEPRRDKSEVLEEVE